MYGSTIGCLVVYIFNIYYKVKYKVKYIYKDINSKNKKSKNQNKKNVGNGCQQRNSSTEKRCQKLQNGIISNRDDIYDIKESSNELGAAIFVVGGLLSIALFVLYVLVICKL